MKLISAQSLGLELVDPDVLNCLINSYMLFWDELGQEKEILEVSLLYAFLQLESSKSGPKN